MFRKTFSALIVATALSACGSATPEVQTITETTTESVEENVQTGAELAEAGSCRGKDDCGSCMAIPGCVWTANECANSCMMDTWCITPDLECPALPAGVLGSWQAEMSSRSDGRNAYVSGDRDLGPARYRQRYTFNEDGTAEIGVLAPNDAHYSVTGRWTVEPGNIISLEYERRDGERAHEAFVYELSGETLFLDEPPAENW